MNQNNTMAWVSYITIVGWIIALVVYNDSQKGNTLVRYHLRQSLGLMILSFGAFIALAILGSILPFLLVFLALISKIVSVGTFVLFILGVINAVQGKEKPLPLVGELFEEKLTFIN